MDGGIMSMLDHGEFEESPTYDWQLATAEEIAITASRYAEQPCKEDWKLLQTLFARMERSVHLPLSVPVEVDE